MKLQIYSKNHTSDLLGNVQSAEVEELSSAQVPNDSLSEIIVDNTLSFTDQDHAKACLAFCRDKLRLGGELIIIDIDITSMCRNVFSKKLSVENFNKMIKNRINIHDAFSVKSFFMSGNIIVESLVFNNETYTIKFQKI